MATGITADHQNSLDAQFIFQGFTIYGSENHKSLVFIS